MRLDIAVRNRIDRASYATNVLELRAALNDLVNCIQNAIDNRISDVYKQALIARKGLFNIAKNADGQMAFVCGQYAATIEHMIDIYKANRHQEEINKVFDNEVSRVIAIYLWKNKCSELQTVDENMHIVKHDNGSVVYETVSVSSKDFERAIVDMKNVNIILRNYIGEREYIELSANGYAYMRRHYFEKEGINLW